MPILLVCLIEDIIQLWVGSEHVLIEQCGDTLPILLQYGNSLGDQLSLLWRHEDVWMLREGK